MTQLTNMYRVYVNTIKYKLSRQKLNHNWYNKVCHESHVYCMKLKMASIRMSENIMYNERISCKCNYCSLKWNLICIDMKMLLQKTIMQLYRLHLLFFPCLIDSMLWHQSKRSLACRE